MVNRISIFFGQQLLEIYRVCFEASGRMLPA